MAYKLTLKTKGLKEADLATQAIRTKYGKGGKEPFTPSAIGAANREAEARMAADLDKARKAVAALDAAASEAEALTAAKTAINGFIAAINDLIDNDAAYENRSTLDNLSDVVARLDQAIQDSPESIKSKRSEYMALTRPVQSAFQKFFDVKRAADTLNQPLFRSQEDIQTYKDAIGATVDIKTDLETINTAYVIFLRTYLKDAELLRGAPKPRKISFVLREAEEPSTTASSTPPAPTAPTNTLAKDIRNSYAGNLNARIFNGFDNIKDVIFFITAFGSRYNQVKTLLRREIQVDNRLLNAMDLNRRLVASLTPSTTAP